MNLDSYISKSADSVSNRLYEAELQFFSIFGERLKSIYGLNDEQIKEYLRSGDFITDTKLDVKKVERALAQAHAENLKDINRHFKNITAEVYGEGEKMAEFKSTRLSPLTNYRQAANPLLRKVVSNYAVMAKSTTVNDNYKKTIRQYVNRLVNDGEDNAPMAMRKAIRELTEQGISTIGYAKGRRVRMDSAVRNSLFTEYGQIVRQVQQKLADEIGMDGVEISVEHTCAWDHEDAQGHVFTNEEFEKLNNFEEAEDIEGVKIRLGAQREIGTGQYNCHHQAMPFMIGISEPSYGKDELEKVNKRNKDGAEFEGKKYTLYELTQLQRRNETEQRRNRGALEIVRQVAGADPAFAHDKARLNGRIRELRGEYDRLGKVLEPFAIRSEKERTYNVAARVYR